jgi:hypothetical protein
MSGRDQKGRRGAADTQNLIATPAIRACRPGGRLRRLPAVWLARQEAGQPPLPGPETLIGSSAIRIRRNPPRINHLIFSNRLKTRVSWSATAHRHLWTAAAPASIDGQCASERPTKLLIGSSAIRIHRKPRRINHLRISNRLKSALLGISHRDSVHPCSPAEGLSALISNRNNSPTENALTP